MKYIKEKIPLLIVHAEPLLRKYIASCIIPMEMFNILESADIEDARKTIIRFQPLVIILDQAFLPANSWGIITWAKNYDPDYHPFALVYTIAKDDLLTQEAFQNGADYLLQRNFSRFELIGILTNLLQLNDYRNEILRKEQQYRTVFEIADDPMFLIQLSNMKILDLNTAAIKLFNYEREDFYNTPFIAFARDPEKLADFLQKGHALISGLTFTKQDGKTFPATVTSAYFVDRSVAIVSITDKTESNRSFDTQKAFSLLHENVTADLDYRETVAFLSGEENERRRISREIHDHIGQFMVSVKLHLENIMASHNESTLYPSMQSVRDQVVEAIASLRKLSSEIMIDSLPGNNLTESIKKLVDKITKHQSTRIETVFETIPEDALSDFSKSNVFRIAEESLTNALKHTENAEIIIRIENLQNKMLLTIQNSGKKIKAPGSKSGLGLNIMQHRAAMIGGILTFEVLPKHIFRVKLEVPYQK
jgi:signal transduction histidine kinase